MYYKWLLHGTDVLDGGDLDLPYIEEIRLADYFRKSFEKSLTNESLVINLVYIETAEWFAS